VAGILTVIEKHEGLFPVCAKLAISRISAGFSVENSLIGAHHLAVHLKIVYFSQVLWGTGNAKGDGEAASGLEAIRSFR
jgi:hypothetical protein